MKKKIMVGYGFKSHDESFETAIGIYAAAGGFLPNLELVKKEIAKGKKEGDISKRSRPKIFKISVRLVD